MAREPREFLVVDAFTAQPFGGNPAAVLPVANGLTDELMQSIATEFNLSETTFILPVDETNNDDTADVRFRWFTPATEVDMCGHATIAGVHAMVETGLLREPGDVRTSTTLRIATRSGVLTAFVENIPGDGGRMIWLELVPADFVDVQFDQAALARVLGIDLDAFDNELAPARTPQGDVVVFVRDTIALNDARPDFPELDKLLRDGGMWGLSLATVNTVTPSIHVQSRFFAPAVGINEDPVTGSVHGLIAAYLVKHGRVVPIQGLSGLNCLQGIPGGRVGMIHALVKPRPDGRFDVRIGGQAVSVMRGTMTV